MKREPYVPPYVRVASFTLHIRIACTPFRFCKCDVLGNAGCTKNRGSITCSNVDCIFSLSTRSWVRQESKACFTTVGLAEQTRWTRLKWSCPSPIRADDELLYCMSKIFVSVSFRHYRQPVINPLLLYISSKILARIVVILPRQVIHLRQQVGA